MNTVFPRNLTATRFYFKALFGVVTIRWQLDIKGGRDRQTCGFDDQHYSPFVRMNNMHAVNPLPCSEISRTAFIGMICLKVQRYFKGGNNSRCGTYCGVFSWWGSVATHTPAKETLNLQTIRHIVKVTVCIKSFILCISTKI